MQQSPEQKQHHRYYKQRLHGGLVAYEEKTRAIDFAPEDELDARTLSRNGQSRMLNRHSGRPLDVVDYDNEDDGRQRTRVKTRHVMGTRATDLAAMYQHRTEQYHHHPAVRTRPVSAAPSVSNYTVAGVGGGAYFDNRLYESHRPLSEQFQQQQQPSQHPPPPATVQSPVVKRVAAAGKQRKQRQQGSSEGEWIRPRASSESSFGGLLFFGWRRAQYEGVAGQRPDDGVETKEIEQQPVQYRGKNLHNFSFTDAKIYSPQSQYQQQQQQQLPRQSKQQNQMQSEQQHRAKIWWTMETMGAVNSAHSSQMMLSRGTPAAVKVQGDYDY